MTLKTVLKCSLLQEALLGSQPEWGALCSQTESVFHFSAYCFRPWVCLYLVLWCPHNQAQGQASRRGWNGYLLCWCFHIWQHLKLQSPEHTPPHPHVGDGGLTKSCPTLATPWTVACQAPLSMRLFLQARGMEWIAIFLSRGSSPPRDWTQISWIAGKFFSSWATGQHKYPPRNLHIL